MALDLLWGKRTKRNFGRDLALAAAVPEIPPSAGLSQASELEETLRRVARPYRGITVARQGRGAVVSKKWLW